MFFIICTAIVLSLVGQSKQGSDCQVGKYDYCHRGGDCYLHDIKHINASAHECLKACSEDCKCVSVQHRCHDCWLKEHRCSAEELDWKSGYNDWVKVNKGEGCAAWGGCNGEFDYCHRAGDCYLRDIKQLKANTEDCKKVCSLDCNCTSVQQRGDDDCWLKSYRCSTEELTWKTGFNDWVKVNKGEGCATYPDHK